MNGNLIYLINGNLLSGIAEGERLLSIVDHRQQDHKDNELRYMKTRPTGAVHMSRASTANWLI